MLFNFCIGLLLMGMPFSLFFLKIRHLKLTEKELYRTPFSKKLLRPAGESLRLKIDNLSDQLNEVLMELTLLIIAPGIFYFTVMREHIVVSGIATAVICSLSWSLAFFWKWKQVIKLRKDLSNYRLGFDGERCVASELEPLLRDGYYVFHDFIYDMQPGGEKTTFNIDHIAIGPEGLFVIETKAKRKSLKPPVNDLAPHELFVEGTKPENTTLLFPNGSRDNKPIQQSLQQADQLRNWLNLPYLGKKEVRPIVVFPGWYIKTENKLTTGVQAASKLAQRIPSLARGNKLTEDQVREIAARLEDKCRNIEGAH